MTTNSILLSRKNPPEKDDDSDNDTCSVSLLSVRKIPSSTDDEDNVDDNDDGSNFERVAARTGGSVQDDAMTDSSPELDRVEDQRDGGVSPRSPRESERELQQSLGAALRRAGSLSWDEEDSAENGVGFTGMNTLRTSNLGKTTFKTSNRGRAASKTTGLERDQWVNDSPDTQQAEEKNGGRSPRGSDWEVQQSLGAVLRRTGSLSWDEDDHADSGNEGHMGKGAATSSRPEQGLTYDLPTMEQVDDWRDSGSGLRTDLTTQQSLNALLFLGKSSSNEEDDIENHDRGHEGTAAAAKSRQMQDLAANDLTEPKMTENMSERGSAYGADLAVQWNLNAALHAGSCSSMDEVDSANNSEDGHKERAAATTADLAQDHMTENLPGSGQAENRWGSGSTSSGADLAVQWSLSAALREGSCSSLDEEVKFGNGEGAYQKRAIATPVTPAQDYMGNDSLVREGAEDRMESRNTQGVYWDVLRSLSSLGRTETSSSDEEDSFDDNEGGFLGAVGAGAMTTTDSAQSETSNSLEQEQIEDRQNSRGAHHGLHEEEDAENDESGYIPMYTLRSAATTSGHVQDDVADDLLDQEQEEEQQDSVSAHGTDWAVLRSLSALRRDDGGRANDER